MSAFTGLATSLLRHPYLWEVQGMEQARSIFSGGVPLIWPSESSIRWWTTSAPILSLVLYTSTFISSLFANWCIGKLPSIGLNVKNYIIYSIRGKTGVLFHVDSPGSFFHTHYNAESCCGGCLCVLCFHVASVLIPMCVVSICCLFSYVYSCHPFCNISETGERRLGKGTHLIRSFLAMCLSSSLRKQVSFRQLSLLKTSYNQGLHLSDIQQQRLQSCSTCTGTTTPCSFPALL